MIIIGCDFHTRYQQIAMMDQATGELTEQRLEHESGETRTYDGRQRLSTITDGSAYSVTIPGSGGYAPDGDILAANDSANANWSYLYDDFNRLIKATPSGQSWFYTYAYDRFGNRWQQTLNGTGGSGPTSSLTFDANNHIASGNNVTYDAAGNVTADPTNTYVYDAESRITSTTNTHTGVVSNYVYDASGQRVRKTSGSVSLDYIYDLAGRVVAEVNSTGGWTRGEVFAGGRHLATYNNNTTYFIHADWLGTERARSNTAGTSCETITSLPFGDNQATSGACSDASPLHFTGKQRDPESNLDYFGARYDSSSLGRFMSADPKPVSAHPESPQTWNRYTYTLNNPLNSIDPDGKEPVTIVFRAFIPQSNVGLIARGDGRSFSTQANASSRITITMHIETDPSKNGGNPMVGKPEVVINTTHNNLTGKDVPAAVVQAPTVTPTQDANGNVSLNVQMNVHSGDMPESASIRSDVNIGVNEAATQGSVKGIISGSPAFETNFTPEGSPTTNLPIQTPATNAPMFIYNLTQTNFVDKTTPIQKAGP